MRPILDKNIERMKILAESMKDREMTVKEASDLLGINMASFYWFLDTFTENYPVYEYRKGNTTYLGLLKRQSY